MTAIPKYQTNNIINLSVINGKLLKKEEVRYNKDGSIDKRHTNKVAGVSSEVYPFTTKEEIKAMVDLFNKRIDEAPDKNKRQIACRNKMLFLIGINLGLRASDLVSLKWNFFFDEEIKNKIEISDNVCGVIIKKFTLTTKTRCWKDSYKLRPKKTKTKYVTLFFNKVVKKAILDYIEEYPINNINDYIFKSRKGNKNISEKYLWELINKASIEANIKKNIGSHSLRKTFGYWAWHNSEDKSKTLVTLQKIFNHSSQSVTAKYIGLTNDEMCDVFNSLDLGLDYI